MYTPEEIGRLHRIEEVQRLYRTLSLWRLAGFIVGLALLITSTYALAVTLYVGAWHYTANKWELVAKTYAVQLKDCTDRRRAYDND